MTLLDEYQALPGEPKLTMPQREKPLPYTCTTAPCVGCGAPVGGDFGLVPDICAACDAEERARFAGRQVRRRDAIIRLLCRALRETLNDMSEPTFSDPRISYIEVQVTPAQLDEARALLAAVERDF